MRVQILPYLAWMFALSAAVASCSQGAPVANDVVAQVDTPSDLPDDSPAITTADVVDVAWTPPSSCFDAATVSPTADAGDAAYATDATDFSDGTDIGTNDARVSVSGNAFAFTTTGGPIAGAYVSSFEHPEKCVRTNTDGYFRLDGFAPGEDVSLLMYDARFPLIQTGTNTVSPSGISLLGFQAPDYPMYNLLQTVTRTHAQPDLCQIATTVTEVGFWDYDITGPSHGTAGATVTITPPVPAANGPIYFNWYAPGQIVPDRTLTETSRDGGLLFLNVPPGDYVLEAHKTGLQFRPVRIRCRAGLIVNAFPPYGLQAL